MSNVVLDKFDEQKNVYDTFTQKMASLIREILSGSEISIHSVTHRTKDRKSLAKKLAKANANYTSLEDVTDISAVRITTYFDDDVDKVVSILLREFDIDAQNSVDKRMLLDPDRFGYLSTHHVATLGPGRCNYAEYRRFTSLKFEIQTRSILQHAWAEIEHDLGYKSIREVPKQIRRRFSRLSGLLELADSEFTAIRDQLALYNDKVLTQIHASPEAVEINKDALLAFAQNNQRVRDLDDLIARLGGWDLENVPDATGVQLAALSFIEISTIAELTTALDLNADFIERFANEWLTTIGKSAAGGKVAYGISFTYLVFIVASNQGRLSDCMEAIGVTGKGQDLIVKAITTAIQAVNSKR